MVTFLCAFSIECFTTTDRNALWISAAAWILVAFLVIWVIYSAWEDTPQPVYKRVLNALERGIRRISKKESGHDKESNKSQAPTDPC